MNSAIKGIYTVGKVTLDLSEIYNDLLKSEQNNSLPMLNLPPPICTDTSTLKNASNITVKSGHEEYGKEILSILEGLQRSRNPVKCQSQMNASSVRTEQCRLSGSFVPDTVFILSRKVLIGTEIKVIEKGLEFVPIQKKPNESELRRSFKDFCR